MKSIDLIALREGLETGKISPETATECMTSDEIKNLILSYLLLYENEERPLEEGEVQELSILLEIAYYIYTYSGLDSGMTDTEYDKLVDMMSSYKGDFVTLPTIKSDDGIEYHAYPILRGTLTKIHYLETPEERVNKSRKTFDQWISSTEFLYEKETATTINLRNLDIYVFPKWDGVSIIFEFDDSGKIIRALTRGYTKFNTAENVTQHFSYLNRPLRGNKYGLKTEVMVKEDDLIEYNLKYASDYKQSRAIASGIVNSDDVSDADNYLQIIQLRYMEDGDIIEKLCPEVFNHPFIRCKLGDIEAIEEFAQQHRFVDGLRCDGVVIHIIDPDVQKVLGRKNDKNNFEVAYKFTEESALSTVIDVGFQVGLFGRIAPVVKFKPVKLKGNTISSATLGSIARMEYLSLAKGDTVKILYDIIPYATYDKDCIRSGNDPIVPDTVCPSCGEHLSRNGAILSCENLECDCRKKGKLLNFLIKMNIKGISYSTIDVLYDMGIVKNIKDLYRLKEHKHEITSLPGFGDKKFNNWVGAIDAKRTVKDSVLFGAIGVPGCAQLTFEKIFNLFTVDEVMDFVDREDVSGLQIVSGIGKKKSPIILDGLRDNKKLLKFLIGEMTEIIHDSADSAAEVKFKVCFTKIRDTDVEREIEQLGGMVVNSITMDTDYCVVPNMDVSSSKTKNAAVKGVPIVDIEEFRQVLNRMK